MKRYAIVGTPTPGDGWSSYFDSWRTEDTQVPTYSEPVIVDDESHPDLSDLRFNMDMEVDWTMDMQSPYVGAAMHSNGHNLNLNGKTRLNVAHPDHQRHGLQRHDVDAWQRPWLVQPNDDVLGPLHQIQIGAGVPGSTDPRRGRGTGTGTGKHAYDARSQAQVPAQVQAQGQNQAPANTHPHSGLGVRRALKVKVSNCPHHCPPFASLFPVHGITAPHGFLVLLFPALPALYLVSGFHFRQTWSSLQLNTDACGVSESLKLQKKNRVPSNYTLDQQPLTVTGIACSGLIQLHLRTS
ncbi:hypothetical protein LTR84_013039 [Exophiala bonariae]|uniref:Uncharacterized protein n=1 Tax=Exophiala bonariae TaxID=1690606 RepID=A0AAV9NDL8_9EURO|nr:hypothetical protein LTR84_013039 [Exophiala bonariae]